MLVPNQNIDNLVNFQRKKLLLLCICEEHLKFNCLHSDPTTSETQSWNITHIVLKVLFGKDIKTQNCYCSCINCTFWGLSMLTTVCHNFFFLLHTRSFSFRGSTSKNLELGPPYHHPCTSLPSFSLVGAELHFADNVFRPVGSIHHRKCLLH